MSSNDTEFDLNVFNVDGINLCSGNNNIESWNKCISIRRIESALKYYEMLDIIKNKQNRDVFELFMTDIYHSFLNDFNHLICVHNQHLYGINISLFENNKFRNCNISQCQHTARHHIENHRDQKELSSELNFYVSTMDSLHFYLFHCYDAGFRVVGKTDDDHDDDNKNEEKKGDEYFDADFNRLHKIITKRKNITASFKRFKSNNKFNIKTNVDDNKYKTGDSVDSTFMDELYKQLVTVGIDDECINKLCVFLEREEFESESVQYDQVNVNEGNISMHINNQKCMDSIKQFIFATQSRAASFSIGFRFYYWPYYEAIETIPNPQWNQNNHNGYKVYELVVKRRYSTFKQEIRNYKYLDIKMYHDLVVTKANKYKYTDIVKATKPKTSYDIPLRYAIGDDTILGFDNLVSLILYCDFSELSDDFSSSFRKIRGFETLASIKNRNSHYYWFSKILRETVEIYGTCGYGDTFEEYPDKPIDALYGPFYCGMSWEMAVSDFNIRLNSPTSTSTEKAVACKFSGDEGIIIKLDNPRNNDQYKYLRGFNCSWISKFKEEAERLFCGGLWRIKVETIILRRTKQNFELFINSIYYIDCIMTASEEYPEINSKNKKIIRSFICQKLERKTDSQLIFDQYINTTFQCFTQNKQQLILDLYQIEEEADKDITDLIFYDLERSKKERDSFDFTNLFRKEIFVLFPNITTIIIASTECFGEYSYSLSLLGLLNIIQSTSLQQVIVKAVEKYRDADTWIDSLWWSSSSTKIKKEYESKHYTMSLKNVEGRYCKEDWLIICKG